MFKFRRHKPFIPPTQKITDKETIVKYAKEYLKTNSLIDMNGFIWNDMNYKDAPTSFIRDTAYLMWGKGKYDFADTYKKDEYLLIKKQSLVQRYPIAYAILLILTSAGVSLLFSKLGDQNLDQRQLLKDKEQDSTILRLQDDVDYLSTNSQIDTMHQLYNSKNVSKFNNADTTHK